MGVSQSCDRMNNIAVELQELFECHGNDLNATRVIVDTMNTANKVNDLLKPQNDVSQKPFDAELWESDGNLKQSMLPILLDQIDCVKERFKKIKELLGTAIEETKIKLPSSWDELCKQLKGLLKPYNKCKFSNEDLVELEESNRLLHEFILKNEERDKKWRKETDELNQQIAKWNEWNMMKENKQFVITGQTLSPEDTQTNEADKPCKEAKANNTKLFDDHRKSLHKMLKTIDTQRKTIDLHKTNNVDEDTEKSRCEVINALDYFMLMQKGHLACATNTLEKIMTMFNHKIEVPKVQADNKTEPSTVVKEVMEDAKLIATRPEPSVSLINNRIVSILKDLFKCHHKDLRILFRTISVQEEIIECHNVKQSHDSTFEYDDFKRQNTIMSNLLAAAQSSFKEEIENVFKDTISPWSPEDDDFNPKGKMSSVPKTIQEMFQLLGGIGNMHSEYTHVYVPEICHWFLKLRIDVGKFILQRHALYPMLENMEAKGNDQRQQKNENTDKTSRKRNDPKVILQLYYVRNDKIMKSVAHDIDKLIQQSLNVDATIEHCTTPEQLNPNIPLLVLCINSSRLISDGNTAIKGINLKDQKHAMLLVFYHINIAATPFVKGSIVGEQFNGFVGIHHMVFFVQTGIYECKENNEAINAIVSFIQETTKTTLTSK